MAVKFVSDTMGNIFFALGLYDKFLEICPENIWAETFGGWPVGSQIYHALAASAMFLSTVGASDIANPDPEAGNLKERGGTAPSRENAAQFMKNIRKAVEGLASSMTDDDLSRKNEKMTKMMGRDMDNEASLSLMGAHMLYHLGSCDAALRQAGLEGVF